MTQNQLYYLNMMQDASLRTREIEERIRSNIANEQLKQEELRMKKDQFSRELNFETTKWEDQKSLNWFNSTETARANRAREDIQWAGHHENVRSNLAREEETHRANVAHEEETHRSNLEREQLGRDQLSETIRSNKANEAIGWANNAVNRMNAAANQMNAYTSRLRYDVDRYKMQHDSQIADRNQALRGQQFEWQKSTDLEYLRISDQKNEREESKFTWDKSVEQIRLDRDYQTWIWDTNYKAAKFAGDAATLFMFD